MPLSFGVGYSLGSAQTDFVGVAGPFPPGTVVVAVVANLSCPPTAIAGAGQGSVRTVAAVFPAGFDGGYDGVLAAIGASGRSLISGSINNPANDPPVSPSILGHPVFGVPVNSGTMRLMVQQTLEDGGFIGFHGQASDISSVVGSMGVDVLWEDAGGVLSPSRTASAVVHPEAVTMRAPKNPKAVNAPMREPNPSHSPAVYPHEGR